MQPTDKQEIRQFTTQFLISNYKVCPMYIKKKMAKVYVNIGRLDWPQFFPDFYHNILQVSNSCLQFLCYMLLTLLNVMRGF